jgi:NAD(P)-dependent dehydrogenase (short-subunit alcohol dehydrogenase family)
MSIALNHGYTAIVTGAGRGIGRATAIELARAGARVTLVARTRGDLNETSRLCNEASQTTTTSNPPRTLMITADVSDSTAMREVVARTLSEFGRIDAVINNAGYAPMKPITETDDATWKRTFDVNVGGAFYLVREAWAALTSSRGAIVNISSEAARDPLPGFVAYAPAKAAVNMLTTMFHREGKPLGIRAYGIAPAGVETDMLRSIVSADLLPTDQTLDPFDVARAIVACLNGSMKFASGETIYIHRH